MFLLMLAQYLWISSNCQMLFSGPDTDVGWNGYVERFSRRHIHGEYTQRGCLGRRFSGK